MEFPLELDTTEESDLLAPTADDVAGLLRRAARALARLEESPARPGDMTRLRAASHAVHRALIELEPLDAVLN